MYDVKEIRLPDEVVNYLQQLDYEIAGLQVLHTHAINVGTPKEKLTELREQTAEKVSEFRLAKNEMWKQYGQGYPNSRWWVDYQEGVLHIEEKQILSQPAWNNPQSPPAAATAPFKRDFEDGEPDA